VRVENGYQAPIGQSSPTTMLCVAMKTGSPSTREPFLPAPNSIGIVLHLWNKLPHLIDAATLTMAGRASAQRNTAVARRRHVASPDH
jgi:hypothetical protein